MRTALLVALVISMGLLSIPASADFEWNRPQAQVLPTGDLRWAPRPFQYVAGDVVRYIDFENGRDGNPGTREKPWKRHPWDRRAGGRSAAHQGPTTYVFKRGVTYRGELRPDESGTADRPIRLTSDPTWGRDEARFYGSQQVTRWTRGAHPDMPAGQTVWHADVKALPRHVWLVDDAGHVTPLKLARTPNWDGHADPRDPMSEWFAWENPRWWEPDALRTTIDGRRMHLGIDTKNLTRSPDYYEGSLIWTQWGTMMGMPYATEVQAFDPDRKTIAYEGPWHRDTGTIRTGHRYHLEDNPRYLDEAGEFWFDRADRGRAGRLYLRLPGDVDPNDATVEVGDVINFIDGRNRSHIHISGLTFRFGTVAYDLAARFFEHPDVESGVIRLNGNGRDIRIRNNLFEHVSNAVQIKVAPDETFVDLIVADNEINVTDHHAINFVCQNNRAHDIRILRNRCHENGLRGIRPKDNFTINLDRLQTGHVAGNVVTRAYAAGINLVGGKPGKVSEATDATPMVRILVHHNKVVDSLLAANDWGGIETWQSGPYYVYNNVSGNPVGPFHGNTFGFAYYMDGSFKNYLFNNIAWGRINDPDGHLPNFAAFQEIITYHNSVFNNTAYKFMFGSRRQAPQAGLNKYMGNVFADISVEVFRHTDSRNTNPNAADAGEQKRNFAYATNAYAGNVLHDLADAVGSFHELGGRYRSIDRMAEALRAVDAHVADVGVLAETRPLRDPEAGDFRPTRDSAAIDRGVRVFVPWGLYDVVAEWNFTVRNDDPALVTDEHFVLTNQHINRSDYYTRPTNPLHGRNITDGDFVEGALEDWTRGAVRLDGETQYLVTSHEAMAEPFSFQAGGEERVAGIEQKQTPDIGETNFLIEAYLTIEDDSGILVRKADASAGYDLSVDDDRHLVLTIIQGGEVAGARRTALPLVPGRWHHVIAEVERGTADGLRLYLDGELASGEGEGTAPAGTLRNTGDFLVGGGPGLDGLACTIDFLRVARGTLAQARTSIEELHTWQFAGPQYRDFAGQPPRGSRRDAGALEADRDGF
jgi:hypothetical protein